MRNTYLLALLALSALLFTIIYVLSTAYPQYDINAIYCANALLTLLSVSSYFLMRKKLNAERAQVFVNGVYGTTLLRLMVSLAAILLYLVLNKGHLHKPSIFVMLGLYLVYTVYETFYFSKISKRKIN